MNDKNQSNNSITDEQQELDVVTRSNWWVPADWKIVDGEIHLPDGRIMKFWTELELVDNTKDGPEQYRVLEWGEAMELVGIVWNNSYSEVELGPIKEP